MCCATQPPQVPNQGQIGVARSGARAQRLDKLCALGLDLDQRPLAGQGAGNDRAVGREPMPMRIERDDRNLLEQLSHGARRSEIPAPRRRQGSARG